MKKILLLAILATLLTLNAQVPSTLSWQGVLQDNNGDLLDGQYTITTKIFYAQTGGNQLWAESQAITIENGITNLILGKTTALNLDFEEPYWLEITIDNGNPLDRIELTSVPYAFTAKNVEDKAITYDKLQDANGNAGAILMWDGTEWTESTVNDDDAVIGNEVTGNADGTLVRSGAGTSASPFLLDVSPLGIDTPELANSSVTTAKIDNFTILEQDIASDQVVFSIGEVDRIKNDVYLVEGPNIKIDDNTPLDGDIKISAIIPNKFVANFVIINNIGDTVAIFKNDSVVINKHIYIYGKSYHYETEYYYKGIEHPLEGGGKLVINQYGLIIYNEAGEILVRFDENGSLHNVPETYNEDITRNHPDGSTTKIDDNGITQRSADGKKTTTSTPEGFTTAEELEDGSVNETENTPTGTKNKTVDPEGNEIVKTNIGQDEDGNGILEIYDKDGNLIFKVDKDGSYHYVKEYFYEGTVVQNEDGSQKVETNPSGVVITETDDEGNTIVTGVGADGTTTTWYDPDGNLLGGSESGVEGDGSGYIAVYDENGNLIYYIDGSGSYHYVPEYYYGNIEVQDEEGNSTTTVTPEGTNTEDQETETKITTNTSGVEVTAPGLLGLENTVAKIGNDGEGNGEIEINNEYGIPIFRVDKEASHHYVPEYYYGGIYAVEADLFEWMFGGNKAKLTDLTTGEEITEIGKHPIKPGGYFSAYDNDSETSTSSEINEDGFEATGDDGNTLAKLGQSDDGNGELELYDEQGNLIFKVDETGSYHNVTEHFREGITIGNDDYDAEDGYGWYIGPYGFLQYYNYGNPLFDFNPETGLTLYDYEGNPTSQFTPWGSTHNTLETFNEGVEIPTSNGGKIKLDENGIEIEDESGNTKTKFNNDGTSEHYGLETYFSGLTVPFLFGGDLNIGNSGMNIRNNEDVTVAVANFSRGFMGIMNGGGTVETGPYGFVVRDGLGNITSQLNGDGLKSNHSATFHENITLKPLEGSTPNLILKNSSDIVLYEWDLDSWDSYLPSTFHNDATHNGDLKLKIEDPENPPSLEYVDSFFDVLFKIEPQGLSSSLPFNLTGDFNCDGEVTLGDILNVSGNANMSNRLFVDANPWDETALVIDQDGQSLGAIGGFWAEWSDIRLKENLIRIPNAIKKVKLINGYYYNLKSDETKSKKIGVIAQEIEQVLPELVHQDDNGYKNVEYSKLTALLIEAVKEQQLKIEELNKKIETQNSQIQAINQLKKENQKLNSDLQNLYNVIYKINAKLEEDKKVKTVKLTDGE
jgi:hypothetical protein